MLLYHYYDKIIGPFKNLSDLPIEQANRVLQEIAITKPNVQCAKRFDLRTISFTYGDSHPTFSDRINDEKEYRKRLYTYDEILEVIEKYGLPQDWNDDGRYGPERYIEAHIRSDDVIEQYLM